MQGTFDRIYQGKRWLVGSGVGSLPRTTEPYRRLVHAFIRNHAIGSVLDIGCGDWQFSRLMEWGAVDYVGMDVVEAVIKHNREQYERPNITFLHGDACTTPLPEAELVLIKDVLQHWRNEKIHRCLARLGAARFVLITNTTVSYKGPAQSGLDIDDEGAFRPLDLRMRPFQLPCTELLRYDARQSDDLDEAPDTKTVLLWRPNDY